MRAMFFREVGRPLELEEASDPEPEADQVLIEVEACAVCRTDLHIVDGDLADPRKPLIPGHEIVGVIAGLGRNVSAFQLGQRVGVPWLGWTCGECRYCRSGRENLCGQALFTGYQIHGGYAESTLADQRYCLAIPDSYGPSEAAPLLCAGLIGYRCLVMTGEAETLGIFGFGAAAHIVTQVAQYQGRKTYAFTRPGDRDTQEFARSLGAVWAGDSTEMPPVDLDAAIIFAPVGELVPRALRTVCRGGVVVCGGIHMSDIPSFPYDVLWGERQVRSVANLTRRDGLEFLAIAPRVPVRTRVKNYALAEANQALDDLRAGRLHGAAVLEVNR